MSKHRKASKDRHTTWATTLQLTTLSAVRVALQERFPPPENLPPTIAALVAHIDEGPDSRSGIERGNEIDADAEIVTAIETFLSE